MTSLTNTLPDQFAQLMPFIGWSLATETERNKRRNSSDMDDILAFAQAMLADVDAVVAHLDPIPLEALPPAEKRLMYMLLSLAEVAPAVEAYRQPGVIDGYDPARFVAENNFVMRPKI
ncbi:hypothetical protein BH09PSE5_BH09PSE5_20410 [soil metagenome]